MVSAILSDYNVLDPYQSQAARDTLVKLQKSAKEEEDTGFDASASSGVYNGAASQGNDSSIGKSLPGWSSSTDDTELSNRVSSLNSERSAANDSNEKDATYGAELDSLDQGSKELMLIEMFPGLKQFDIHWTLKKDRWDIGRSINDLMTQSFMEETGVSRRGIEAFSEVDLSGPARKGKGRKKKRVLQDLSNPATPESPTGSKWDTGRQDIDFVSTRTGKSITEITSLYYQSGASIRTTIIAVLEAHAALKFACDDPLIDSNVIDLRHEFPSIQRHLLLPLVQVTHPSKAHAHELAKALVYQPGQTKSSIQIEFRHAPLGLDLTPPDPKASNASSSELSLDTANGLATKYTKEREEAFTQAQAAYRRGKSDHLMGGATAYYSEVGRTAGLRLKTAQSAAADALVANQSSGTQLDLHGVTVQDGKRIAKERVTNWWHELGESRIKGKGISAEYKIVTGVGYHSEGGRGRLAPAILKMLMQDGWKVQVGTGVLVVTGIAKK